MKYLTPKEVSIFLNRSEKYYTSEILPRIPKQYKEGKAVSEDYLKQNFLPPPNHLSVKQVASIIHVSEYTVRYNKSLNKTMVRNKYWIPKTDVDAILERLNNVRNNH